MLWIKNLTSKLPRHPTKTYNTRQVGQVDMLVIHTTVPFVDSPQQLAEYAVSPLTIWPDGVQRRNMLSRTGAPAVPYHYLVGERNIYQALRLNEVSWHASGYNTRAVGIGLLYNPLDSDGKDRGNVAPPEATLENAIRLCVKICRLKTLLPGITEGDQIFGHRELLGTGHEVVNGVIRYKKSCPGFGLDMDTFREAVEARF